MPHPLRLPVLALFGLVLSVGLISPEAVRAQDATSETSNQGNPYASDPDRFFLPQGLEASIWAESPRLYNPTNIDVDAEGRVWVVEAVNYRNWNNPTEGRFTREAERVVILEDTDGDGRADTSKVFVEDEDIVAPLGIAVFGNRAYVSASPGIYVYTDTDGDDRADQKETFLDGFGGVDHDHGVHSITAGPDGRFYFTVGNAGPHVVEDASGWTLRSGVREDSVSGPTVLESDDGRKWLEGLLLRVDPNGTDLTVRAHNFRNNYEGFADSFGDQWMNDNDDDGYASTRVTWVMPGGNYGYASRDGLRSWGEDRRPDQSTYTAHWHQEDPGVVPPGDHTGPGAPTGIAMYESDVLGEAFQGTLLSVDSGKNTVWGYRPKMNGAGWTLEKTSFFSTVPDSMVTDPEHYNVRGPEDRDRWYRPSDVAVGTDGSIYVADWYDEGVGYHRVGDSTGYGRIFRISPEDRELEEPEIDLSTTEGQLRALMNPAKNVRFQGFVRLREQGTDVVPEVTNLLEAENPYHRARAVWLLVHLGPDGIAAVEDQLESSEPRMRIAAYRALRQVQERSTVLGHARELADDPSPAVRRAVAVSLRKVPLEESQDVMVTLARYYHPGDRHALEAYGLAARGDESAVYELLVDALEPNDPTRWSRKWADLTWRLHPVEAVDALEERARSPYVGWEEQKRAMVALGFIEDRSAYEAMRRLSDHGAQPRVAERAAWWLDFRNGNLWASWSEDES